MTVGEQLKRARQLKGMTLMDVEERTGIEASNISKIEHDKKGIHITTLQRLCKALNITVTVGEQ